MPKHAPDVCAPAPRRAARAADECGMQYRAAAKFAASWECNLLVVAADHLVLCQARALFRALLTGATPPAAAAGARPASRDAPLARPHPVLPTPPGCPPTQPNSTQPHPHPPPPLQDKKLQLYDFTGAKQREWCLDAVIRYIKARARARAGVCAAAGAACKLISCARQARYADVHARHPPSRQVVGGPPRREALLVGLKNGQARGGGACCCPADARCGLLHALPLGGAAAAHTTLHLRTATLTLTPCIPSHPSNPQVVKVFIDNPFPIPLIAHSCGVRCLDASPDRRRLALVDEQSKVVVYDLETKVGGGLTHVACFALGRASARTMCPLFRISGLLGGLPNTHTQHTHALRPRRPPLRRRAPTAWRGTPTAATCCATRGAAA